MPTSLHRSHRTRTDLHVRLQGSVYSKIMDEVIENCVVTFEEDGVERRLLDEVKKVRIYPPVWLWGRRISFLVFCILSLVTDGSPCFCFRLSLFFLNSKAVFDFQMPRHRVATSGRKEPGKRKSWVWGGL